MEVDEALTSVVMMLYAKCQKKLNAARVAMSLFLTGEEAGLHMDEVYRSMLNSWRARYRREKHVPRVYTVASYGAMDTEVRTWLEEANAIVRRVGNGQFDAVPKLQEHLDVFLAEVLNVLWAFVLYEPQIILVIPETFTNESCQREPSSLKKGERVIACASPAIAVTRRLQLMHKARVYTAEAPDNQPYEEPWDRARFCITTDVDIDIGNPAERKDTSDPLPDVIVRCENAIHPQRTAFRRFAMFSGADVVNYQRQRTTLRKLRGVGEEKDRDLAASEWEGARVVGAPEPSLRAYRVQLDPKTTWETITSKAQYAKLIVPSKT